MNNLFSSVYTVTIGDINYGGHLGNERALLIFQDARIRFFKSLGFSERDIGGGVGIVVVESGCSYLRQVFLHEELEIHIKVEGMEGKKCTLQYTVFRSEDGQKVLSGFTVILAYNYSLCKVVQLPGEFVKKVQN
jgi:acyl-CoA thioester hydrolase